MLKQILGRIPKRPSKSVDKEEQFHGSNSVPSNMVVNLSNPNSTVSSQLNGNFVASYEALPRFKDIPVSEKESLFIKKLHMCCIVFDFRDGTKYLKEKEIKRQTLLDLANYVALSDTEFSDNIMQDIINMVAINLFRSTDTIPRDNKVIETFDYEEDDPQMDPAWSHLQVVYEILLSFIMSPQTDAKLAKRYIDRSFILRLLDLFDSEDQRERECLKSVLHRIYRKFMVHRPFIRKSINNIFFRFVFETEKHNGITELLEIFGSIINGFALPLKEEHKLFLVRALIPLHKPKCVSLYHHQLSYCIMQFAEKDCKLTDTIIRGLLKYWPVTNSSKEVLFLGELEEVLAVTQSSELQRCMVPLFRQIARCLNSPHFQVAEKTLMLWSNDHIENLVKQNHKVILPILLPALEKNIRGHWNKTVQTLTQNLHTKLSDQDPKYFHECLQKFQNIELTENEKKLKRDAMWRQIEEVAASKVK